MSEFFSEFSFEYQYQDPENDSGNISIAVKKFVNTDNLDGIVQAFHDFLVDAGFPYVERVRIETSVQSHDSKSSVLNSANSEHGGS